MALPPMTDEQRAAGLAKAAQVRTRRAETKKRLKRGAVTLAAVLAEADAEDDGAISKMHVSALLQSMPGVGEVRAKKIMEQLGIADNRRIGGLGSNQRQALEAEFAA